MKRPAIAIYGTGGSGRETAWLAQACSSDGHNYQVVGLIDDDRSKQGTTINDLPVMSLDETCVRFPECRLVIGVGSSLVREELAGRAAAVGLPFATLIHPRVERSEWIDIGIGTVICAGSILTVNIVIGDQVQINTACTIAHDVIMKDYVTLAPGVHISGHVHLGRHAYVGTGAVIKNGTPESPLVIGDGAVIGAGACVTQSVLPGVTVVGVPARPIQRK